jgi:hypothetical protein
MNQKPRRGVISLKSEREMKVEWLSRSKPLRLRLIGLRAERAERLSRADYAGISNGERCGRSGNATEGKYIALVETEAELRSVQQELDEVEAEIREVIERVRNPLYQTYLRMRFLGYKTEWQIAAETGYSFEHIKGHVHRHAIDSVKLNTK